MPLEGGCTFLSRVAAEWRTYRASPMPREGSPFMLVHARGYGATGTKETLCSTLEWRRRAIDWRGFSATAGRRDLFQGQRVRFRPTTKRRTGQLAIQCNARGSPPTLSVTAAPAAAQAQGHVPGHAIAPSVTTPVMADSNRLWLPINRDFRHNLSIRDSGCSATR